jgi:hypothetical protein
MLTAGIRKIKIQGDKVKKGVISANPVRMLYSLKTKKKSIED